MSYKYVIKSNVKSSLYQKVKNKEKKYQTIIKTKRYKQEDQNERMKQRKSTHHVSKNGSNSINQID